MQKTLAIGGISAEALVKRFGTPLYVYDEAVIRDRVKALKQAMVYPRVRMLYACKANTNLGILRILREEGMGIDAVSGCEVKAALLAGFAPKDIIFTGNNVADEEMREVHEQGVLINMDSISQVRRFGAMFPGTSISLRINPDVGAGHHNHTITGGPDSKFGIYYDQLPAALKEAERYQLKVIGLHEHIGSGILETDKFLLAMEVLLRVARDLHGLEFIDFGGGIGVPYLPSEKPLDLQGFGKAIADRFSAFCKAYGKQLILQIEPGRFPVCEAGWLLARVNTIKRTPKFTFVGLNTGFNHLIRPTMYGSYHPILNASAMDRPTKEVVVAGNVCESGDIFTPGPTARSIPEPKEGDILAIANAGAYGFVMASEYNLRPLPAEVLVIDGNARFIRKPGTFEDLMRNQDI